MVTPVTGPARSRSPSRWTPTTAACSATGRSRWSRSSASTTTRTATVSGSRTASRSSTRGPSGWTLDLDGIQDAGEPTRSTKDGEATFSLLPTATYQICEVTKDDWINTDPGDASVSQRAPCKSTGLIEPGRQPDVMRFGNTKPEPVDQVVRKYNDKNGDGRRQAETPSRSSMAGPSGSTLTWTASRTSVSPGSTTEDGKVVFSVLPTRPYWVCEITQDDWINTDPGSGRSARVPHARTRAS